MGVALTLICSPGTSAVLHARHACNTHTLQSRNSCAHGYQRIKTVRGIKAVYLGKLHCKDHNLLSKLLFSPQTRIYIRVSYVSVALHMTLGCDDGWVKHGNFCFLFSHNKVHWAEAEVRIPLSFHWLY